MKGRINWVDIAKGIGIILVVFGHVSRGINTAGLTFSAFSVIDTFIYSFHMPLFFALSGYFFVTSVNTHKEKNQFLKSKSSTILYPYLTWSLIQILIQYGTSHLINGEVSLNDVLTFYVPRGQFWFLIALFTINTINFLFYKFLNLNGILLTTIASLIALALNLELGVLSLGLNNIVYFNFGILLFQLRNINDNLINSRAVFIIVLLTFILTESSFILSELFSPLFKLLTGLLGTLVVAQLSAQFLVNHDHMAYLGKNSLPIFLMHTIFGGGVRIILCKFLSIDNIAVHLLIGTLAGIYFPLLLYRNILSKKMAYLFAISPGTSNK